MTAQSTKTKVNQPLPDRYYGAFRTLMFAKQIYADQSLSTPFKIVLTELLHFYIIAKMIAATMSLSATLPKSISSVWKLFVWQSRPE